ncbi:MAG: heme o synthase [Myxococcota bacterium]|nr:heme o synthase [Myxococcota bacterium]
MTDVHERRLPLVRDLWELTKPKVTRMNLLMTVGGLALAGASFRDWLVLWTVLGTALAVASANALNMYLERDTDGLMARTANRPLPTGRMVPQVALSFGLLLGLASLAVLGLKVNLVTMAIAAAALVTYVLIYTPMKRTSPLALVVGAIPGAAPPLMGWTAVTGSLDLPGLVLFAILFVWQLPHFIAIALYRKDDYERAGVRVVPVVRGDRVAKAQALAWTTALVPISLLLVPLDVAGAIYGSVALVAGLWFLSWSLRGMKADAGTVWARRFFFVSLVYLPVLTLGLVVDLALL